MAQHRVLIFCQLKSMLDIVEHDLLKPKLPTVTYLRLDGSVPAGHRHSIVSRYATCVKHEALGPNPDRSSFLSISTSSFSQFCKKSKQSQHIFLYRCEFIVNFA